MCWVFFNVKIKVKFTTPKCGFLPQARFYEIVSCAQVIGGQGGRRGGGGWGGGGEGGREGEREQDNHVRPFALFRPDDHDGACSLTIYYFPEILPGVAQQAGTKNGYSMGGNKRVRNSVHGRNRVVCWSYSATAVLPFVK